MPILSCLKGMTEITFIRLLILAYKSCLIKNWEYYEKPLEISLQSFSLYFVVIKMEYKMSKFMIVFFLIGCLEYQTVQTPITLHELKNLFY